MKSGLCGLMTFVSVLICLDFPVVAQTMGSEVGRIENPNTSFQVKKDSLKLAWADVIVPDFFQQVGWKSPALDSSLSIGRSFLVIPIQFETVQEISVQEQQSMLVERENEAIYKQQSDPQYFEKMEERFRLEFNKRMKAREQQQ